MDMWLPLLYWTESLSRMRLYNVIVAYSRVVELVMTSLCSVVCSVLYSDTRVTVFKTTNYRRGVYRTSTSRERLIFTIGRTRYTSVSMRYLRTEWKDLLHPPQECKNQSSVHEGPVGEDHASETEDRQFVTWSDTRPRGPKKETKEPSPLQKSTLLEVPTSTFPFMSTLLILDSTFDKLCTFYQTN